MKSRLAAALLAVLAAPLIGCSARLSIKTDVANPSAVAAVRLAAAAHSICRTILTGEEKAALQDAISAITRASKSCAEKLSELAEATQAPDKKDMLQASVAAVGELASEFEPALEQVLSARTAARFALGESSEAPCSNSERHASILLKFDEKRKDNLAELHGWVDILTDQCGTLSGVSDDVQVATEKTKTAESIIGSGSLTRSDYAFAVATLDEADWNRFNVATGNAHGGNLDVAIKMNEPGDFTVKGMRFDASKSAELVGKSLTQVLLLAAGHAGLAPASSNGGTMAIAPHNALASAQASQVSREAMEKAYRIAAVEIALLIGAEAGGISVSDEQRKAAIQRIKSVIASHAPRLDLSTLP